MRDCPTIGEVVRLDPALDALLDPAARIERLASGLTWSEGPVWDPAENRLLFSDIPRNTIYEWTDDRGLRVFMQPSGYTGVAYYGQEPGSNALTFDSEGRLCMCEHGDRRISRLDPRGGKRTLADAYRGKRLNSPNDLAYRSNGDLYFTDPAYGLPERYEDTVNRELPFCGVFLLRPSGEVVLLSDELEYPNGVAFSPDEQTLYVTQSSAESAIVMAYRLADDGTFADGEVFFDATAHTGSMIGLPDGLAVDQKGNVFTTGPGGVWVLTPDARPLGRISPGVSVANACWGEDGSTLYLTAHMYLCRIRTKTIGVRW